MPRILLVEDDLDNRVIVRTYLEHVGHEVVEAHDGDQAVERARDRQPDLILLDIGLPRRDGWEVARILKGDPDTASIPIIALTAHVLRPEEEEARKAGCDGFLAKPIDPREVGEAVERHLVE